MRQSFLYLPTLLLLIQTLSGQVNVLTANYGTERTNATLSETTLTPIAVGGGTFARLGAFPVDGQIYAQPLYVSGLTMPGVGAKNVVYAVTMHNGVYAIDADAPSSTTPLWYVNLGPSIPWDALFLYDINPELGILGTPVIDLGRGVMYVVSDTWEQNTAVFRLHALSLTTGQESLGGPTIITAAVPGVGSSSHNGMVSLVANQHLQRPGLLLANDQIYIGMGSHNDASPYHGWLLSYDASNIQKQTGVFNTSPNADGGAIWHAGRAPMVDSAGNIYVVTGNGFYDGTTCFGESFLKLSPQLQVVDWFTPVNWKTLSDGDYDLGSTGAAMIPGTTDILAGNKYGTIYSVNMESMGHLAAAPDSTPVFQPVRWGGVFNFALWPSNSGPLIYVLEQGSVVRGFQMTNGQFDSTPFAESPGNYDWPYDGIAVSANGGDPASGVVWVTTGNHGVNPYPGTLHAYHAKTLQELWNSDMDPSRDYLGLFAKFAVPTIASGKVFVPTFSNQLSIYGLLPSGTGTAPPQLGAVVNAASYSGENVSPGELITIFGSQLGPSSLVSGLNHGTSALLNSLAGVQVLINGVSAPLVYVSANQLSAIVPFGITGSTAQVTVQAGAQTSNQLTLGVLDATPGIFSADSSGAGQIAAANQDWSANTATNPAAKGSVIVLYATGGGLTNPVSQDGTTTTGTLPKPVLPVSVQIDGQDAAVLYAGAAPDIVAGVMQVNVRIPANAASGPADSIVLKIGNQASRTGATVAVQ